MMDLNGFKALVKSSQIKSVLMCLGSRHVTVERTDICAGLWKIMLKDFWGAGQRNVEDAGSCAG